MPIGKRLYDFALDPFGTQLIERVAIASVALWRKDRKQLLPKIVFRCTAELPADATPEQEQAAFAQAFLCERARRVAVAGRC